MIPLAIATFVGFVLGCLAARNVGWDNAVDYYEESSIAKAHAQAEKDRRGWRGWWPFAAAGAFVVVMVVLGLIG